MGVSACLADGPSIEQWVDGRPFLPWGILKLCWVGVNVSASANIAAIRCREYRSLLMKLTVYLNTLSTEFLKLLVEKKKI